jgi:hypothetical protein
MRGIHSQLLPFPWAPTGESSPCAPRPRVAALRLLRSRNRPKNDRRLPSGRPGSPSRPSKDLPGLGTRLVKKLQEVVRR